MTTKDKNDLVKNIGRIVVTLILLIFAIVVLLKSGSDEGTKKAAIMIIGSVIGYWLR